jgi:hypothetical protein
MGSYVPVGSVLAVDDVVEDDENDDEDDVEVVETDVVEEDEDDTVDGDVVDSDVVDESCIMDVDEPPTSETNISVARVVMVVYSAAPSCRYCTSWGHAATILPAAR